MNGNLKAATVLLILCGSIASACGNAGEESSDPFVPPAGGGAGGAPPQIVIGACEGTEDLQKECKVYIEQANGVTSCFTGFQYCSDGRWSDCLDPEHDPRVL